MTFIDNTNNDNNTDLISIGNFI